MSAANGSLVVLCPHFAPDSAPTGTVMTRIVAELVERGYEVHVVTSLPWYRSHAVEPGWRGRLVRREVTPWGSISRIHPFPAGDKTNLVRRGVGFIVFSLLCGLVGLRAGGFLRRQRLVIAMSPPLTLGPVGWLVSRLRRTPFVVNIQDVFPDAAVHTGAITNERIIALTERLEHLTYAMADAITVLSDDLADNVRAKTAQPTKVEVIPNFVDTAVIAPADRDTRLRRDLELGDGPVVLYAGNVGYSQSLDLVVDAARVMPDVMFLINGDGVAATSVQDAGRGLTNLRFNGYIDPDRLPELLATGDVHVVPLKQGLGHVSVPSKTYSSLAAGRPVVAAIDEHTAVPNILSSSGGGIATPPDDLEAFVDAIRRLVDNPQQARQMGACGRRWVAREASPGAVGDAYDQLNQNLSPR